MKARKVTPGEVAHFRTHGWVHLPAYIPREAAAQLQDYIIAKEQREQSNENKVFTGDAPYDWRLGDACSPDSPSHFMLSPETGENVARLLDVRSVRFLKDEVMVKKPSSGGQHIETYYHQDFPALGMDRSSHVVIWVSTIDQPAEAGLLRFRSKSHQLGALGRNYNGEFDIHERYPALNDLEMSPEWDMQAGDATVHGALTVHGAAPNKTDQPRYAHGFQFFDAEALFTGARATTFEWIYPKLVANQVLDYPETPIVYPVNR
jgi:ectoine hydroxylase-related dioxygenase (phytanoyl-CoA dioxygenase family)